MPFPQKQTLATYGGALNDLAPVSDPTTDRAAASANEAYASTAAMTRTASQLWVRYKTVAGAAPVLMAWNAAWPKIGNAAPALSYGGTGSVVVTLPTSILDELGNTQTVYLLAARRPNAEGATLYGASASVLAPNLAQVLLFTAAGALTDAAGTVVFAEFL
jgi:hypothetical protein